MCSSSGTVGACKVCITVPHSILHTCMCAMYMNGVLCVPSEMIIPTEASPTSASSVAAAELTYAQFMQYIQKDTMYVHNTCRVETIYKCTCSVRKYHVFT